MNVALAAVLFLGVAGKMHAQAAPPLKPVDSLRLASQPPISPARAFIASGLVPGLGQSVLKRGTGALFVAAEAIGLAMFAKAKHDLAIARAYTNDSTPLSYTLDAATGLPLRDDKGQLQVSTWSSTHYPVGRVRARKTYVEDWTAFLIFNHLFAAVDAMVASQLWNLPAQVGFRAAPNSVSVSAKLKW